MTAPNIAQPTLAIVIVNWNVRDLLRDCLKAVAGGRDLAPGSVEMIVVDNASSDDSAAMVRADFPWVRLIESGDNLGFAKGCQIGYESTDAPFVMLLNPDTLVDPDAIASMLSRIMDDDRIGIIGSRLRNSDGSFQRASGGAFPTLRNMAWNYLFLGRILPNRWAPPAVYLADDPPGVRPIDWVSGASLTFRRAAVGARIFHPRLFHVRGRYGALLPRRPRRLAHRLFHAAEHHPSSWGQLRPPVVDGDTGQRV